MRRLIPLLPLLCLLLLPAPAAALAESPSLDEVRQMLELSGSVNAMQPLLHRLSDNVLKSVRTKNPNLPEEAYKAIGEEINAVFQKMVNEIVNMQAAYYAGQLTREEVGELTAFYQSPVWRKYLAVGRQYLKDNFKKTMQELMPRMMKELTKRVHDRLIKDGYIKQEEQG